MSPVNVIEQQILTMSDAEIDDYPIGIIQLDRQGTVLAYNKAQAQLAQRSAKATIGLNFFREVAPCTAVKRFQGTFNEAMKTRGSRIERFKFEFPFAWGVKQVTIGMVRRVRRAGFDTDESIFIVIYSTPVDGEESLS
jgi:photoactive yellow protein